MKYQVMIELVNRTETILDAEGLDCDGNHKYIEKLATEYIKGKRDMFDTISSYKQRASDNDSVEVWIAVLDDNYELKDYEYVGVVK